MVNQQFLAEVVKADKTPAINITDMIVRYGKVNVVDGLNLTIPRGMFLALLGPNGAGKTTTLKVLTTMRRPTQGKVEILGIDALRYPNRVKQVVGITFQDDYLYEDMSPIDNLLLQGRLHNVPPQELSRRITDLLTVTSLQERARDPIRTFSGGMKRRLAFARSLIHEPEVLFLDEPTTGLDPQSRHVMWDQVAQLRQKQKTLVLTTHYMDEAEALCDYVVILDKGKIIVEGTPLELRRRYVGEIYIELQRGKGQEMSFGDHVAGSPVEYLPDKVRITVSTIQQVPDVISALHEHGVLYQSLISRPTTLEDVFLQLTGRALRGQ